MVSKPYLVTFLEQMKDPRNIRRMETTPIYTGMSERMEPMTQVRGPRISEEVVLCQVVFCKKTFHFLRLFLLPGLPLCCPIPFSNFCFSVCLTLLIPFNEQQSLDLSNSPCSFHHLPHSVSSIIPEFISRDYFSHSMRTEILPLACDNLHELATLSFLGDLRKTVSISE